MNKGKTFKNFYISLVFLFLYLPIIVLVVYSFNSSRLNILFEDFTFKWYKELFGNETLLEALKNTLIVSVISTVVSTIIGTISAYALKKYKFPFKNAVNELLYVPIVIPEIVLGIALLSMYTLFQMELSIVTIILAHIAFSIPFVVISVRSVLDSMGSNIEDAAADLGASPLRTFVSVVLPTIMPGITSGALLAFTLSLDDVVISYFTAGPGSNTLPLELYSMIKTGVTPDVNALATLILLTIFIVLAISTFVQIRGIRKLKVRA